jgi:hypothetical protein
MVLVNPTVNGVSLSDSGLNFMDYSDIKRALPSLKISVISTPSARISVMAARPFPIWPSENTSQMFSYAAVQPFRGRVLNQEDVQSGAELSR